MKLFFRLIIGIAILATVVALYCALILAGRSDKYDNNGDDNESYGDFV